MISKESFSKNWTEKQRARFPKADPQLIERQIYAFELVGVLAKSNQVLLSLVTRRKGRIHFT